MNKVKKIIIGTVVSLGLVGSLAAYATNHDGKTMNHDGKTMNHDGKTMNHDKAMTHCKKMNHGKTNNHGKANNHGCKMHETMHNSKSN